jgi:diacylglycerol kinase family enzyme
VRLEADRIGIRVHVLRPGDDPAELAREAAEAGADVLGMAGGDGSLASVASVALERDLHFVVVPLGTRNHFARDLGLDPEDAEGALAAFGGTELRVDAGFVGDRLFLNNVSLGLYASFVHDPRRKTRNRLLAFLRMVPAALGPARRPLDLSFVVEGRRQHRAALAVLVANNDYRLESMADLGERTRLDRGLLCAYVVEAVGRRALLGLLLRAPFADVEQGEGLIAWSSERFSVESPRPRIHAAIDGEPVVLDSPLEFEIRPRSLRVLLPTSA